MEEQKKNVAGIGHVKDDFDPNEKVVWLGRICDNEETPTGVGSMVYNSDMTESQKNNGKTAAECCIYEPPTCSSFAIKGTMEMMDAVQTSERRAGMMLLLMNKNVILSILKMLTPLPVIMNVNGTHLQKNAQKKQRHTCPAGVECVHPS